MMKTIYLDIMIKDRFICQMEYKYCPLFPIDSEELEAFVIKNRPSLKNKNFRIEFSDNKL